MIHMQNLPAIMPDCYEHINGPKEDGANNQKVNGRDMRSVLPLLKTFIALLKSFLVTPENHQGVR